MHENSPYWNSKWKLFLGRGHRPFPRPLTLPVGTGTPPSDPSILRRLNPHAGASSSPNWLCAVLIDPLKSPGKCKSFWPQFFQEGRLQFFYDILLAPFTVHRLPQFSSVSPFADLRLRSLAMKWNAEVRRSWSRLRTKVHVVWDDVGDSL